MWPGDHHHRGAERGGPLPYELCPGVLRRSHNTEVPVPIAITATIVSITIRIPHTKGIMCMIFVYNLSEIREEGSGFDIAVNLGYHLGIE